jgi:hypothetical protein
MRTVVLLLVLAAATATARAEPSDRTIVLTGLALAPPDYLLGVTLHEGSHALMAKLVGAEVVSVHLFPPGIDPLVKKFRFGWTYVRGLETKTERILFYIAPKITDALLLGGFAALVFSDAWPSNRYGEVALTVFGTGLWVDFSKDVVLFSKHNDVTKVFHQWCMDGWKQLPARLVYAGLAVGAGLIVAHAYVRTFDDPDVASARTVPVLGGAF